MSFLRMGNFMFVLFVPRLVLQLRVWVWLHRLPASAIITSVPQRPGQSSASGLALDMPRGFSPVNAGGFARFMLRLVARRNLRRDDRWRFIFCTPRRFEQSARQLRKGGRASAKKVFPLKKARSLARWTGNSLSRPSGAHHRTALNVAGTQPPCLVLPPTCKSP
jgi:hypothetical protein